MPNTELLENLDAAIAEKNLLKHPFYQDWQAGKLTRESLQLYARQYYKHVEAFPEHLRVLAARADESLKPVVLENLAVEENPEGPHPKLWRDFAGALGVYFMSRARRPVFTLLASGLTVAGVILTAGFSMFPFLMPSSSHPGSSLTLWDSVSSHRTLQLMFWVTVFFLPLIAMYTSWVYYRLRGTVNLETIRRDY